jgi:hypothetical protein
MTALSISYQPALQQLIACPGACFDPRVGVPVSASLPSCRQAVGRGARVPAFLPNLLHSLRSVGTSSRCREGLAPCGQRLTGNGQW